MARKTREFYRESLTDWLTHRRTFKITTETNPRALRQRLVEHSAPLPPDGNPLTVTTPVSITHSEADVLRFEINVARGLPVQEGYYIPFRAMGQATQAEGEEKWVLRGEIVPLWQGIVVYMSVLVVLLLWVTATVTSAAISEISSYAVVWVALGTTAILTVYMMVLQWRDMRLLVRVLRDVTTD